MVRLTKLRIDRFRNVKPGTELRFGPTFNVLLGKNATGKSTLLDLVAAVTNDDLSVYASEDVGFDLTWWIEVRREQLEVRAVRTPASGPQSDSVVEEREFDDRLTVVLRGSRTEIGRLEVVGTHGSWTALDQDPVPFDLRAGIAAPRAAERALSAALSARARHPRTAVPSVVAALRASRGYAGRFDEALVTFEAITHASFEQYLDSERRSGSFGRWFPVEFITALPTKPSPEPAVVPLDKLEPLKQVPGLLGFASAELRPRLVARRQENGGVRSTYDGLDVLFRRADGLQIAHPFLSFGQKRLFSFLWYLAVREQLPVVADELFNGLHHEWIEVCMDRLYERQSFLATQHPYLLDHIPIESADSVRTTFVRCTLDKGPDGREQMVWRNFNEDEAERFFVAYQTGIQQVSEVLRTEGLW